MARLTTSGDRPNANPYGQKSCAQSPQLTPTFAGRNEATLYERGWATFIDNSCKMIRIFTAIVSAGFLSGCATIFYERLPTGKFSGKLDVEWISPNQFIYRPHAGDPLKYVTSDGHIIQPRTMYTDGGSIPRLFWSFPDFGPWDFAPGYVIHDWLFEQHHCKVDDWQAYDLDRAAEILAEAIKTQMVASSATDATAAWAIYEAVRTPIAKKAWDIGVCKPPPPLPAASPAGAPLGSPARPVVLRTISF